MIRRAIRIALGLVVLAILSAGTYWAVNAIDEELTAEARELLQPFALEAAGSDNAWQAGTGFHDLPESKPENSGLRWFALRESPIAQASSRQPNLQWLLIDKARLYAHYRRVRGLPRYGESTWPTHPLAQLPIDSALTDGGHLALAEISLAALDGRLEEAIAELEREATYHRRVLAGSRTLLGKVLACNAIVRDMAMASDLLSVYGEKLRPHRERLMRVVAPLPREDLDLSAVFELEARFTARSLPQYRDVIWKQTEEINKADFQRRFWAWEAFGYRIQATENELARRHAVNRQWLRAGYEQAWNGRGFPESPGMQPPAWRLVNPTGHVILDGVGPGAWGATYLRRMKDVSALVGLVGLQAALTFDERKRTAFLNDVRNDPAVVLNEPFKSSAVFDAAGLRVRYKPSETRGAAGELAKRFDGEFVVPVAWRGEAK